MSAKNKFSRLKKVLGFTLVEIMIVVTIIGILASLAVPAFQRARWKALETSIRNNLKQIWGAGQQYMMENGVDVVDFTTIVAWQKKDGSPATGTNAGYTGVIKQISSEDYDALQSYRTSTNDAFTDSDTTNDHPSGLAKMLYDDTMGLIVKVTGTGGTAERYVKLKL